MIRKLHSGQYRLYSRKVDPKTGKKRNLGTFDTRKAAQDHERAVQYFKRHSPGMYTELQRLRDVIALGKVSCARVGAVHCIHLSRANQESTALCIAA